MKNEEINVSSDRGNNVANFISFNGPSDWVSGNNKTTYLNCIEGFPEAIKKPFTFKKTSDVVNFDSLVEMDLEKKRKELEQIKVAAWPVVTTFVQKKICPITHDNATMLLQNIAMQVINNIDSSIVRVSSKTFTSKLIRNTTRTKRLVISKLINTKENAQHMDPQITCTKRSLMVTLYALSQKTIKRLGRKVKMDISKS